jgi:hypothetical protein
MLGRMHLQPLRGFAGQGQALVVALEIDHRLGKQVQAACHQELPARRVVARHFAILRQRRGEVVHRAVALLQRVPSPAHRQMGGGAARHATSAVDAAGPSGSINAAASSVASVASASGSGSDIGHSPSQSVGDGQGWLPATSATVCPQKWLRRKTDSRRGRDRLRGFRLYAGLAPQAPRLLAALRDTGLLLAAACLADSRDLATSEIAACAEGIVGDLVRHLHGEEPACQAAADALAEVGRWGANEALRAAFADADRPELALAALLALARGGDRAPLQALLADQGSALRLLHTALPGAAGGVRTHILALLERLGKPLAYVPAGDFEMGSDDGAVDERRSRHRVTLAEYWIDRHPVTNAQYAAFVDATGYRAQGSWQDEFSAGKERHPVVLVTWPKFNTPRKKSI